MNEHLKVNSKTDILEFKRKHNLLVENGTIKANVSNIKTLSNDVINNLRCGDVVLKEDSTGKHAYLVSFKSDTGLCLTYCDAYCVETQSYDLEHGSWVYNSEDKTIIAEPQMENIVDSQGHKRFIEGNITIDENVPTGTTQTYGKWSLSGTHLMIVLCLKFANGTTYLQENKTLAYVELPNWVLNKIVPTIGLQGIEVKTFNAYDSSTNAQSFSSVTLAKLENNLRISKYGTITFTAQRECRISFDLLIDSEEQETQGE